MDDVQNISATLYGKAEPTTAKTTMSVREMQHLLGLGKTDSYWLLHKNFFEVILINDKMRIVISSFEKWYANQVKYHKVNGPSPGEELCKRSYSVLEVAEILKVDSDTVYTLVRQGKLKAETVDFWMRIPKEEFERWYRSQSRHRTAADRERDREIEAQTISIPEMAKLLGIPSEPQAKRSSAPCSALHAPCDRRWRRFRPCPGQLQAVPVLSTRFQIPHLPVRPLPL